MMNGAAHIIVVNNTMESWNPLVGRLREKEMIRIGSIQLDNIMWMVRKGLISKVLNENQTLSLISHNGFISKYRPIFMFGLSFL